MNEDYAARARALVGVRFRPQGRGDEGLDCLGLILATYQLSGVRRDYRLRGDHLNEVRLGIARHFRKIERKAVRAGDALLLRPAVDQLHFAVRTERGFVHSDAGIGRVVETPGWPRWPLIEAFRKRVRGR